MENVEKIEINTPALWTDKIKLPTKKDNKYSRGWVVVLGGINGKTGATKLASIAALRSGAGMATICHSDDAAISYQSWAITVMTHLTNSAEEFLSFDNRKISCYLLGPGAGVNARTKEIVLRVLQLRKPCVLDADALTVFDYNPQELFNQLHDKVILTPHSGEFSRIFKADDSTVAMVKAAAEMSGCTVLLKGNDTIIASHLGKVVINQNASPYLATAGSGDVLAGIISGLMATGLNTFDAACAATYIHNKAAELCGIGMIAEDLADKIGKIFHLLFQLSNNKL